MDTTHAQSEAVPDVATPAGQGGLLAKLIAGPTAPALAARIGAMVGSALGRPIRLGSTVIAARHADVIDLLTRDLDFRIAPVNEVKIDAVNGGPFVLGMDRGARLVTEREVLYGALAHVDMKAISQAVALEAERSLDAAGATIDVVGAYARPIAAHTATRLFGVGGGIDPTLFMDAVRAIFAHTFLNQANDEAIKARALRAAPLMHQWFDAEIARRRAGGDAPNDMMQALLLNTAIDDDTVRRTLGGMLVGSIDTTASSVAKIVAVIARDKALAAHVTRDLDKAGRLAGWCWEALRRWPHNPIVVRSAVQDTTFNSVAVKKGDQIVAWTQAAMLDASVFPDPGRLKPDRPPATYLHFGAGLHPCAGRPVNGFQIPMLVGALMRRGIASAGSIAWAGPFPNRLEIRLQRTSS